MPHRPDDNPHRRRDAVSFALSAAAAFVGRLVTDAPWHLIGGSR